MFGWLRRILRREPRLPRSWGSTNTVHHNDKPFNPLEFYMISGTYEYHIRSGDELPPMRPLDFREKKKKGDGV